MREVAPLASPSDRTLVSEWARKRKRTGNHIEHVRTDAGCRGEALTRWQTEYRRGDGITFAHPVPISAEFNGERTAKRAGAVERENLEIWQNHG